MKSVEKSIYEIINSSVRAFRTEEIIARLQRQQFDVSQSVLQKALLKLTQTKQIFKPRKGLYVSNVVLYRMYHSPSISRMPNPFSVP